MKDEIYNYFISKQMDTHCVKYLYLHMSDNFSITYYFMRFYNSLELHCSMRCVRTALYYLLMKTLFIVVVEFFYLMTI